MDEQFIITKSQLNKLAEIAKEISDELTIDDDVSGGFLDEPYRLWTHHIYEIIEGCQANI